MSDSLNNKELVAVGHQFAKAMSTDTPIIDMAKIVSRLAERLDCTTAALREMTKKRDAEHTDVLVWEKTMFKVCGEDGPKSVADKFVELQAKCAALAAENLALKKAEPAPFSKLMMEALDAYQSGADDVPELAMLSAYTKLRDGIKTPATDAFLTEVRASTLEDLAKKKRDEKMSLHPDTFALGSVIAALDMQANELEDLAAQIRQGGAA
ncbi:hypothetical protein [Leclercia adecarboxylata]|uniref:hypothetical protein n=1 Tax=Leclercia adecarboxylata TaxID=83655 RepID=UPI0019224B7C|nr:hypothetical protein [Leclercia adecarboxylata]